MLINRKPLFRILAIGIRPTPLRIYRSLDVVCDKSITQYPIRGVPEMIQFKKLVESTSGKLFLVLQFDWVLTLLTQ